MEASGTLTGVEDREVRFDQQDEDLTAEPTAAESQKKGDADVVDILKPKAKSVTYEWGPNKEISYVQRPLSFIGKMEWFSLVGGVLDKSMGGENALSMNSLLTPPGGGRGQTLSMEDFRDADTFVHAVGKLVKEAPDFLFESYFIWLNVPTEQRPLLMRIWRLPEEEGGLSDEDGIGLIETFIDQNYEALERFFRERLGQVGKRLSQRREEVSRQSKPSSPSVAASETP